MEVVVGIKMEAVKKLTTVTALALCSSIATAEIKALDDSTLSDISGQSGITIELETKINIGQLAYRDEGWLTMNNIEIGGSAPGSKLDEIQIDFDIASDGDALINIGSQTNYAIDFGIYVDSVYLSGLTDTTKLMSNIWIQGDLAFINMRVDTASNNLFTDVGFIIQNLDMDVDFLSLGIKGLTLSNDKNTATYGSPFAVASFAMASVSNSNSLGGGALGIRLYDFEADINIAAVELGGTSIGSIAINDMLISSTYMEVYGH